LFQSSAKGEIIDAENGIVMQPKPITELDRLTFVCDEIRKLVAAPKNYLKIVPNGEIAMNEAFKGLSVQDASKMENWQFMAPPTD
jgi:hypothetical protein